MSPRMQSRKNASVSTNTAPEISLRRSGGSTFAALAAVIAVGIAVGNGTLRARNPAAGRNISSDTAVTLTSDEQVIADYLRPNIVRLDHEVHTYHWSTASAAKNGKNQLLSANEVRVYNTVKKSVPIYWDAFGKDPANSMYGPGYYLASDPYTTREFGGDDPGTWILTDVVLPAGMTIFNFGSDDRDTTTDVEHALRRMGCAVLAKEGSIGVFIRPISTHVPTACRDEIRKVLEGFFGVEAIAYDYASSDVIGCSHEEHQKAFILTNARSILPNSVQGFNSTTADAATERARIQWLITVEEDDEQLWKDIETSPRKADPTSPDGIRTENWNRWIRGNLLGCGSNPAFRNVPAVVRPTALPSASATPNPNPNPSASPSATPTSLPTVTPSPTASPTLAPSATPRAAPTESRPAQILHHLIPNLFR